MERFRSKMNQDHPQWSWVMIFSKINQYYFTGTMQDGMLIIPRREEAVFWVRNSYERAVDESMFTNIRPMNSYRDAASYMGKAPDVLYTEIESVPIALLQRVEKYFPYQKILSADSQIMATRSIKSTYELEILKRVGNIHQWILEQRVPQLLEEGLSESDLATRIFTVLMEEGHHGFARFGKFDTQIGIGQLGFGESSLYPSYFDGPGGNLGMSPAMPFWGSRERRLQKGDLVFVDVAFGMDGYHTDKTMNYVFQGSLSDEAVYMHNRCIKIQEQIASLLVPGSIPSEIYRMIMDSLDEQFLQHFMGYGDRKVKFLGHGIGLQIDETPVIATGFDQPLEENMVIALEPKRGLANVGMVGTENSYLVTPKGGFSITGNHPGLILV
ncbi:MAG: aminopeptidase P family protein [Clostridiales bacterium]|nr:aminopeptidase P family protein [Clostridiales bacterium]